MERQRPWPLRTREMGEKDSGGDVRTGAHPGDSCALTSLAAHAPTIFHSDGKRTEFCFHVTESHMCALSPLNH